MAPNAASVQIYDRLYEIYRSLYPAGRELAHQLAALGEEAR
jgi:sugar (pentulose or hexulose) kinase